MLRIGFEMRKDCVNAIGSHFANPLRSDIKEYPINLTDFKFRNMFVVDYGRSTMTVGLCFNGTDLYDEETGEIVIRTANDAQKEETAAGEPTQLDRIEANMDYLVLLNS